MHRVRGTSDALERSAEWLADRGLEPLPDDLNARSRVASAHERAPIAFEDPFGNVLAFTCRASEPARTVEGGSDGDQVVLGLAETHLLVDDIEDAIAFYEGTLGLPVAWRDEDTAFVWTEPGRSWLGLWERWMPENHVAFGVSLDDLVRSETWLAERGIELREDSGFTEPYVRPHQPIGSAYFHDSEGNDLELVCFLPVEPTDEPAKVSLREWLAAR